MNAIAKKRAREIDSILFNVEACYPNAEFNPASLDLWHRALAEYDIDEISKAFTAHVKKSRFLPTIAEIVTILEENRSPPINLEARAQQQWRVVIRTVRQIGLKEGPPRFADPITENLIRTQFSWEYLCNCRIENQNWEQKRWCEAYKLAAEIHRDLLRLEVPEQVLRLVDRIPKWVAGNYRRHQVPKENIQELRMRLEKQAWANR